MTKMSFLYALQLFNLLETTFKGNGQGLGFMELTLSFKKREKNTHDKKC